MQTTRPILLPFVIALSALIVGMVPIYRYAGFDLQYVAMTLVTFLAVCSVLVWAWVRHSAGNVRFGPANTVTFLRVVLVCWIAGAIGQAGSDWSSWFVVTISTTALILDGIDGWLARKLGCASDFGARFDQEIDALLILILAVLVVQTGKAGTWILLVGLLRYLFVAGAVAIPKLAEPLPPSKRRQTICVTTVIGLILCLAPVVTPPLSTAIAAVTAGVLSLSFTVDTVWLLRPKSPVSGKEEKC
ncbi:MAG: CDP-alcohol phosphatidyltransferase family protein [Alphaproteobacteria bacterium]